jgi:hypothetical protein
MTYRVRAITLALLAGLTSSAQAAISFGPPNNVPTAQRPSGAAIADFTGDGLGDLAVTVDAQDRLLLFAGNGAGGGWRAGDDVPAQRGRRGRGGGL